VKEESEKAGLKPNIQKRKIMASSPITSWRIFSWEKGKIHPSECRIPKNSKERYERLPQ